MRASNLREALNVLDPERPLRTDDELDNLFVERPYSPLQDLRILLESTRDPLKILFTGHRGSGKSTELAKLGQQLRGSFFIIHYSIKDTLNLFDLTYVDVLLSLGWELIRQAERHEVQVNPEVLRHVLEFTKDITREVQTGVSDQPEAGVELNLLVAKLSAKLRAEDATRTTIREKVSHRVSEVLEVIDLLGKELAAKTERRVLLVVEDLDKADLDRAKQLFYGHATTLREPALPIIYTFPTALRHDNDFIQVKMNFPEVHVLPGLKTKLQDGGEDTEGKTRLIDLLTRRAEKGLFTEEALIQLAESCSGIPRELIALARRACLEAIKSDASVIDRGAVDNAVGNRRIDYQVLLTSEQLDLLRQVRNRKRVENDEAHRALLHNLSVLEYRNVEVWYDVHPIVQALL